MTIVNLVNQHEEIFTELETIKICIRHRRGGSKKHLELFNKYGRLHGKESIAAHVKNIETIYDNVRVRGKGMNREYIVSGKKKRTTKKVSGQGRHSKPTADDEVINKYIFNMLISNKTIDGSLGLWASVFHFPSLSKSRYTTLTKLFEGKYNMNKEKDEHDSIPFYIVNQFKKDMKRRNKSYIDTAFKQLQRDNLIKLSDTFYSFRAIVVEEDVLQTNGQYKKEKVKRIKVDKLTKKRYNEIQLWLEGRYVLHGITKREITQMNLYPEMRIDFTQLNAKKAIEKELLKEWEIEGTFTGYKITLIQRGKCEEVEYVDFMKAYFNKFLSHCHKQQDNTEYQESTFENKAFYLYNNLLLLKEYTIEGLDDLITEHHPTKQDIENLQIRRAKYVMGDEAFEIFEQDQVRDEVLTIGESELTSLFIF